MATEFAPVKAMAFAALLPSATGTTAEKSLTGKVELLPAFHTPLESRVQTVSALRSASSRNSTGVLPSPDGRAAAPTMRELLDAPLIWSRTVKLQVGLSLPSDESTTARRKFFCASSSSVLPSPSTSAVASQGESTVPPGGFTSASANSAPSFGSLSCTITLIFSYGVSTTRSARPSWSASWKAMAVGLPLNESASFWTTFVPSALRSTSSRTLTVSSLPSLPARLSSRSTMTASEGLAPGLNGPAARASGRPLSGTTRGKGTRPFASSAATPICFSSALSRNTSVLPSPSQSAATMSVTPVKVGKVRGAARVPSGFWRCTASWPPSGSATSRSARPSPSMSAQASPRRGLSVRWSGRMENCPSRSAPANSSAGLWVMLATAARPDFAAMVTISVLWSPSRSSAQ